MSRGRSEQDAANGRKPMRPEVRTLLRGGGAILVLVSLYLTIDVLRFQVGSQRVDGQRVRIERDGSRYMAVVRFGVDGKAYEIKSGGYQGYQYLNPELRLAGPVPVLYRPDRPESGRIATPIE